MAHISSIGASMFSDMSVAFPSTPINPSALTSQAAFDDLFANEIASAGGTKGVGTFVRMANVREFPSMGVPPNITNVPVYGQKTSQQIQGQADAPNIEITLNYVPAEWAAGTLLGDAIGDGKQYVLRFTLLNTEPTGAGATKFASSATGLGTVENSIYYWVGKIEALVVNPQLTDATTATVTMSIQSPFYGAYTV